MDKIRLNNFILWCKNWYQPIDNKMNVIIQAQKILTFDGYMSCNNPILIALNYIDELVEKGIIKPIRLQVWNEEIVKYMSIYNVNYNEKQELLAHQLWYTVIESLVTNTNMNGTVIDKDKSYIIVKTYK